MRGPSVLLHFFVRCGALGLAALSLSACGFVGAGGEADPNPSQPEFPLPPPPDSPPIDPTGNVTCDPSLFVPADSQALVVTDPAILSAFGIDRVIGQLLTLAGTGGSGLTAESFLQRLFDTENDAANAVFPDNPHCDDADNSAFKNGAATDCPRVEGQLASSTGLLKAGDPDSFVPVALVNRMDLMNQGLMTCGELRIVYGKLSGRTDPNDRLFVIFEGALMNPMPGDVMGCHAVAQAWADVGKESDPAKAKALLEQMYFTGVPGFNPLVHPDHFGVHSTEDDPYGGSRGQVRVSQRMQDPWEMREYRIVNRLSGENRPPFYFAPSTVKNNPLPELFDRSVQTETASSFRAEFLGNSFWSLGQAKSLADMRMSISNMHNAGESAVAGAASVDYVSQATNNPGGDFATLINEQLVQSPIGATCPPDDPLTGESIVRRASVLTCAGCHAPEKFLGAERKLGCGLSFPATLGEVHIDENGTLSPALKDVFLPRRAQIATTYLQGCDMNAIFMNLEPLANKGLPK